VRKERGGVPSLLKRNGKKKMRKRNRERNRGEAKKKNTFQDVDNVSGETTVIAVQTNKK